MNLFLTFLPLLDIFIHVLITLCIIVYSSIYTLVKQIVPYKYRSKDVKGEIVLITGSGSGIGKLIAKRFARLGARMVLVDVDQIANERTANEILVEGGNAKTFTCDLSKQEEIYKLADNIKRSIGDINILINNAGIVTGKKFLEATDNSIEKTFKINTMAHFWLTRAFLPSMIEQNHGHIVTMASMAGLFGNAGLIDYCSSKFACVGFDESLRNELTRLGKTGVNTTIVCPYFTNTGMFDGFNSGPLKYLEPTYVADKTVEAVLTNQKVLLLPRTMYFIYFLKSFLPLEAEGYFSSKVFKTLNAMDDFRGRSKNS